MEEIKCINLHYNKYFNYYQTGEGKCNSLSKPETTRKGKTIEDKPPQQY